MSAEKRGLQLDDLLAVEDDRGVLDFRFEQDRMLIWPFVRAQLFLAAIMEAYALSTPHAQSERFQLGRFLKYAWNTVAHSPLSSRRARIVMFVSGIGNVLQEGRYFNRIHDHYAFEFPDQTLLIEDSVRRTYRRPRKFSHVVCNDGLQIAARIRAMGASARAEDRRQIHSLLTFLRERFPYRFKTEPWSGLETYLTRFAARLPFLQDSYMRLLERLRPEAVFHEDASYGTRSYVLKWAKAQGIRTAEFQHGSISRNHIAYNYADGIRTSAEYGQHLPDFYLTYGEYWNRSVRSSSKAFVVGNPYLTESLRSFGDGPVPVRQQTVLFTSGGMIPDELRALATELVSTLGGQYRFVFRPHPGEVPFAKERYGGLEQKGVEIDLSTDLYQTLQRSDIVVGDASTVLYEALAFKKRVFAFADDYSRLHLDEAIFQFCRSSRELADKMTDTPLPAPLDPSVLFAEDWQVRYREFLAQGGF